MLKAALGAISAVFMLASPWVLYWTLSHREVGVAALALIGWAVIRTIPIVLSAQRAQRAVALRLSAIAIGFAVLGWVSGDGTWMLVLPSATQATFGATFLRSLSATPLIEHFARMVKKDLSPGERVHCRRWTRVWGVYLIVLAAIGLGLAKWASLAVWTAYVGVVSYLLVGALFAVEYVVRKLSFRDYGNHPIDWLLGTLFPPRQT